MDWLPEEMSFGSGCTITTHTSVGILSLQTLCIHHVDLSDQLGVATHPRPTSLRRLVQRQLPGGQYRTVRQLSTKINVNDPINQMELDRNL